MPRTLASTKVGVTTRPIVRGPLVIGLAREKYPVDELATARPGAWAVVLRLEELLAVHVGPSSSAKRPAGAPAGDRTVWSERSPCGSLRTYTLPPSRPGPCCR